MCALDSRFQPSALKKSIDLSRSFTGRLMKILVLTIAPFVKFKPKDAGAAGEPTIPTGKIALGGRTMPIATIRRGYCVDGKTQDAPVKAGSVPPPSGMVRCATTATARGRDAPVGDPQPLALEERIGQFAAVQRSLPF